MPLTLEQYAAHLDTRHDLPWPAAPAAVPVKARPHLTRLPKVRAVLWNVYGTLLAIPLGDLVFEHPTAFIMESALEKTIQEFKMWGSMSRKPGQPSEYMLSKYKQFKLDLSVAPAGERHPEVQAERIWESVLKMLMQKDYKFDASFFGALNEYARKIAYFFHASLQGTASYEGAAVALKHVADAGLNQGLLGDGQVFTPVQLSRGLAAQDEDVTLAGTLTEGLTVLSCEVRGRKPSERLFREALDRLREEGITPAEVLHVGSRMTHDLIPAKRLGMHTALFAGDKTSLAATPEQMKDAATKPDILMTSLDQIAEVVG